MSLSLYRKYRPLTFSDVIGQEHIVRTLSNAITHGRISHAYLFTGPRGTGKTTLARIFARAVNCTNPNGANPCLECTNCKNIVEGKSLDIFEIDAASNTGVDNIRELRENVKFPPSQTKYKVYIIDEVHMLSTGAFNALLKTLEEPPAHVIFILATTEIHKVPETIISRCQRYDFTRLPVENIVKKLSIIAKSEKIEIAADALEMIAIAAEGGMRDAESLLSQVMALEDKKITAKEVEEILGTTQRQSLETLSRHLLSSQTTEALSLINKLSQDGYDLDVFNKSFLNYLRQLMLVSVNEKLADLFAYELTKEQSKNLIEQAKNQDPQKLLFFIQCFSEIQGKIKSSFIPQLPLEIAIIKVQTHADLTRTNEKLDAKTREISQNTSTLSKSAPGAPVESKIAPISPAVTQIKQTPNPEKSLEIQPKNEAADQPTASKISAESSSITLNDIRKCWNQAILEIKPLNHSLSAILQSCQPVKTENGIVSIAAKFPFHKDKLNEHASKLTMESVFDKILGLHLQFKTITNEEAGIKAHESRITNHESRDTEKPRETSSLLSSALGIIGGTMVE